MDQSQKEIDAARFGDLLEHGTGLFCSDARNDVLLSCNYRLAGWLGFDDVSSCLSASLRLGDFCPQESLEYLHAGLREHGRVENLALQLERAEGNRLWVNLTAGLCDSDGAVKGFFVDITAHKDHQADLERRIRERREELEVSHQMLRLVMDNIPQGIFWKDTRSVYQGGNRRFLEDAGLEDPRDLIGRTDFELPWRREEADWYRKMDQIVIESKTPQKHIVETQKQADGKDAWVDTTKLPLLDTDNRVIGILGTYEDITDRKRKDEELRKLTNYDVLTGLANRRHFKERLDHVTQASLKTSFSHALILVDLDHFKTINDSLGHHFGDRVLVAFGHRLRQIVPLEWMVARLGGDEFGVLLEGIRDQDEVRAFVTRMMTDLEQPCFLEGHEIVITPSIGIALFPEHGINANDLLQHVDAAVFHAKNQGRNNYQFFSSELGQRARQRLELEKRLRRALENDEFTVFFQPKIASKSGLIAGLEALVRWQDPERGLVGPGTFISFAEESGLIVPISEIVLQKTCETGRAWLEAGLDFGRLAVNLSPLQFRHENLLSRILTILEEHQLPANRLELEITESALMNNATRALALMEQIRANDITLALDDFGTGFSSLSSLKNFPLNTLKIDRSFITDIASSTKDRNIAASIIGLGHYLGLEVVAEGVENREQVSILRGMRCRRMQGFYFAEPMPAEAITPMLQKQARSETLERREHRN